MIKSWIDFLSFTKKIGQNRLLIQGAGGNISVKVGDVLWVKASGCWLQDADNKNIFVPVSYKGIKNRVMNDDNDPITSERIYMDNIDNDLRPSIETTLHALMPHKYVIHTHSVNAIALSVMKTGRGKLSEMLSGIKWEWVPYARPGIPLTKKVQQVLHSNPDILILANHGVVLGASTIDKLESLLNEFEKRVELEPRLLDASNFITSRPLVKASFAWSTNSIVHALAFDDLSLKLLTRGILYPDHVVFLGSDPSSVINSIKNVKDKKYYIVKNKGVLISKMIGDNSMQMIECMANVVLRIHSQKDVVYLSNKDIDNLVDWDAEKFRQKYQK